MTMSDAKTIATNFVQYYYGVFDKDRSQLAPLYVSPSVVGRCMGCV